MDGDLNNGNLLTPRQSSRTYNEVFKSADFRDGAVEAIEALIDKFDLERFLIWTAEVCREKATHIDENWQDHALATQWGLAANKIDQVSMSKQVKRASGQNV